MVAQSETGHPGETRQLVYRQSIWTRLAHWTWAISLFFLLMTGLQIFNAHPTLYIGKQSGFAFDNAVLRIDSEETEEGLRGYTEIFGARFDTTGTLGVSDGRARAFPAWATMPSYPALATARVIHFFFAWTLVGALAVWLVASVLNGHLRRDILPSRTDIRHLPKECAEHARLKFCHSAEYNGLQKVTYFLVLLVFMPLMVATGLAMSPAIEAVFPPLTTILGGRETARTLHFVIMVLLVLFFIVHILMVVLIGPFNSLRCMVTGWYRAEVPAKETDDGAR